ncbi:UMF1 family MFS transporter [Povalibacter uvarum]|uniref:UMF1 family MFS transporter n=1 Tax=Povalibacter uvarum TaxID=732238 RepID=A0A841HGS4_9GAMM|nr:MFS transporter [Povalibacter uvarum]MBB6091432.1 UMF1 family MFS transporter [Povalibacter uvarum]
MASAVWNKQTVSWALFDWGNSAFATTVMVVFFPVFFKQYWSADVSATESTAWLAFANGGASFVLAVLAPLLGTIGDRGGARLKFLFGFTLLGVVTTAGLAFVHQGEWQLAAILFALGSIGFWGGIIFYDSLLIDVAPRDKLDTVSGFGYSIGYLGGGVLLAINIWMTQKPEFFGLANATEAVKASFVTVAVWWALFAIPIFMNVHERSAPSVRKGPALRESLAELAKTVREVRRYRGVVFFLLSYWMYIDGVNTIQKMAVDYGLAIGLPSSSLVMAILMVQFIGFPAALLFGWIGQRISAIVGIFICIAVYAGVTVYATVLNTATEFFIMAAATGCVQGGIQALSRSYYGSIIPAERSGEFFGFYNMMSKFAAVLGPFLMGATALLTGDSRSAILSIVVLFIGGAAMLVVAARNRGT